MSNERATENAGFLDGRGYTAAFLYEFFSLLVGNGVYTNELAPTATNENMTITHGAGHAWINGVCYKNSTPFVLDIATADGVLNRYDSLMIRLDLSANEAYAVIVQGDYAAAPTPPPCVRNAETHDLKICDIYVPAGCTKITQAQITDRRMDATVCGIPVFPVQHMDMTSFFRQIDSDIANLKQKSEAEIGALLQQLRELVSADAVGELTLRINEANQQIDSLSEAVENANTVQTVNSIHPDASHNLTLSASDILMSDGRTVEQAINDIFKRPIILGEENYGPISPAGLEDGQMFLQIGG